MFHIQNPFPQGFDPILSPAFKIFLLLLQSGEDTHESVFSFEIRLFRHIAIEIG
ncbi:MAG: hypothetical protein Q8L52_00540 [bacterium]|nr:hypothetical protein [bacterium]